MHNVAQRGDNEATAWLARGYNVVQRGTQPKFANCFENMGTRNMAQRRGQNVTLWHPERTMLAQVYSGTEKRRQRTPTYPKLTRPGLDMSSAWPFRALIIMSSRRDAVTDENN